METHDDVSNKLAGYLGYLTESDMPLYYQIAYVLEHYLSSSFVEPGTRFFSEEEISTQLKVSRPTVNRAVNILIKNGYLKRVRGKGTVIQRPKGVSLVMMSSLLSFGEMVEDIGREYRTQLLERSSEKPSIPVAEALAVDVDEPVIHLKRLRFVDEEPLIIVDSYIPRTRFSKLLDIDEKMFAVDLYALLREFFDLEVTRAEREVMAARMSLMDAQLLQVELWEPCLRLRGVAFDSDGRAVENFDARLKGGSCILKSTMERPPDSSV